MWPVDNHTYASSYFCMYIDVTFMSSVKQTFKLELYKPFVKDQQKFI